MQPREDHAQDEKQGYPQDNDNDNYVTFKPDKNRGDGTIPLGIGDERAEFCQHSCGIQLCPCEDGSNGNNGGQDHRNIPYIPPGFGPGPVILNDPQSKGCGSEGNPCPFYPSDTRNWRPLDNGRNNHPSTGCGSAENPCPFGSSPVGHY